MGSGLFKQYNTDVIPNPDVENDFIKNLIRSNDMVIFSRSNCGYCDMAKKRLNQLNVKYHALELDQHQGCPGEDCTVVIQKLMLQTRMKTVPQIFYKGDLVGGYTELEKMIADGAFRNKNNV